MATQMPKGSKVGGLGEKVENTLIRFLTRTLDNAKGLLSDMIRAGFELVLEAIEKSIANRAGPMLAQIQSTDGLPDWVQSYIAELQNPSDQGTAVGLSGMAMGAASQLSSALLAPYLRKINYQIDRTAHSARPSPGENFALRWRFPDQIGALEEALLDLGYAPDHHPFFEELLRPRLGGGDEVRSRELKGESLDGAIAELLKRGYSQDTVDRIIEISQLIPGPSDLVRMGVREAWRDDVAQKWGYDADFPADFGEQMKRLGDRDGWAKRYWRSHWELPGLGSVLEMLHRGIITEAEFDEYLRIADYPSGWRERISKVAYTPYTRVDTRRMYRFGVLDEAGVFNTYRDIGYDDEHAAAMTQFTVLDALTDERELTKSDVLKSYRLARFTQAEAQENLVALGYNTTVAAMLLSNEDQAEEESKISGVVSNTHSLYIRGGITRGEVIERLATYNLASAEVDRYFELWDLEKESRVSLPTRSALDGFLSDDIITVFQYQAGLTSLSYKAEAIVWYTQGVLLDKATRAEKEKDRAIAEAEKVGKREVTTAYQRAKAVLTVALREVEARIGELQTAIQARGLQYRTDADFARAPVTVAQLEGKHEQDRAQIQNRADAYAVETREYRQDIEGLQTQIAGLRLELEGATDAALQEEARLQIETLRGHQEAIQTIAAEGRAEIAAFETEIAALVDPTISDELRQRIAVLQTELEVIQDTIAGYRVEQAESKRALLDAGLDEIQGLKKQYLDLAVLIAGEAVAIDEIQTLIAALRELGIDPDLTSELHVRQGLISEIRTNNAQAAVFLQEIDQEIITLRLGQIDPAQAGKVQAIRLQIEGLRVKIEQVQDVIAANATAITELRAELRRLREDHTRDLRELQRIGTLAAVDAGYRADLEALQAELGRARSSKNNLRVELAQIQFEYTD